MSTPNRQELLALNAYTAAQEAAERAERIHSRAKLNDEFLRHLEEPDSDSEEEAPQSPEAEAEQPSPAVTTPAERRQSDFDEQIELSSSDEGEEGESGDDSANGDQDAAGEGNDVAREELMLGNSTLGRLEGLLSQHKTPNFQPPPRRAMAPPPAQEESEEEDEDEDEFETTWGADLPKRPLSARDSNLGRQQEELRSVLSGATAPAAIALMQQKQQQQQQAA